MQMKKVIFLIFMIAILYFIIVFNPTTSNFTYAETAGTLTSNIDGIDENRYPGYKAVIQNLRAIHPNYIFLALYTGMDWNEVLTTEYQGHAENNSSVVPKNLFSVGDTYDGMWQCPLCGNKRYDNGKWCCASLEALSYMMDPRNSINESDVFQFKDLNGSDVSYEDIARVVRNYGNYLNNNEAIQAIVDASRQYDVNGYYLVAKIINEHGANGSTLSNGQGYNNQYVGCYNYFNIGSYGNGKDTIINNGLKYANDHGWKSIRASILGGATVVKDDYIKKYSQITLYFQKFNVAGASEVSSHQYQQNILAAQSQGTSLKNYYGNSNTAPTYTFIIPIFENMPRTACPRPNAAVKNSITYENGVIKNMSAALLVRASANGTKIGALNNDESIKIIRRAGSQVAGYYWDLIVSNRSGTYGYVARTIDGKDRVISTGSSGTSSGTASSAPQPNPQPSPQPTTPPVTQPEKPPETNQNHEVNIETDIKIDENYIEALPDVNYEHIKTKYPNAVIKDKDGKEMSSGKIGTGYTVTIDDKTYTIVKKGDTNGDGTVTVMDTVVLLNSIAGTKILENEYKEAACLRNAETFSVLDAVLMLNYLKGQKLSL